MTFFGKSSSLFVRASVNAEEKTYRVLCILSYNYSYDIVPYETDGIEAGLNEKEYGIKYSITYESMDSKVYYTPEDIEKFSDYLSYKLQNGKSYDVVIVTDDTALRFAMNHRTTLFNGIPIVFMGINTLSDAQSAAALEDVTGVAEVPDLESNYNLMKRIFPEKDTIVAIVDGTTTGQGEYVQFMRFISEHPDQKYMILNTSRYSQNGVKEYLNKLDENCIIFYFDFGEDGDGNNYNLESGAKFISENAPDVPIFRSSSANIGNGVLGGVSYSFYDAAKVAGEMAAEILTGTDPAEIEMVSDMFTIPYFEQSEMDYFEIKKSMLPQNSEIINEKYTAKVWYEQNTVLANLVFLICILLLTIIIMLAISNRKRQRIINTDSLTGIANRFCANKTFKSYVAMQEMFGVIMVDVDYFKQVNDNNGHKIGDEVLQGVAKRLDAVAAENNAIAARIGGDEFMILALEHDSKSCKAMCERVQDDMDEPIHTSGGDVKITLSMGGAVYPDDTDDASKVMNLADSALYIVKKNGRNDYNMYDKGI